MLVALDVGYSTTRSIESGRCGVVAFDRWDADEAVHELTVVVNDVAPYVSGRLFERELPCLVAGLEALRAEVGQDPETIVVDGNVRLDDHGRAGLGMHLHRHLGSVIPVIGVAKQPFRGLDAVEVLRGDSAKPLHITAVGVDEAQAARLIESMAGDFRLPTLLRRADQLANGL